MKLAISNIAWQTEQDSLLYEIMKRYGYTGLEIAPTRIFPEAPYENLLEASQWSRNLKREYGLNVVSMQSIWYGKTEQLFGTVEERKELFHYTKKAVDFAVSIGCTNLVFGCPRNRNRPEGASLEPVISFFNKIGEYAFEKGTVIGLEANPLMYHTNFVNDTKTALELIKTVGSKGFRLNLDTGTILQNKESMEKLVGQVSYVNHVHISEPGLKPIKERELHKQLAFLLKKEGYQGFLSIEMGRTDRSEIKKIMKYVKELFGDGETI